MSKDRSPRMVCWTTTGTSGPVTGPPWNATDWLRIMLRDECALRNQPVAAGGAVGRVEREALISAPPERVWQALVDQRQVSAWFGSDVVLEARTGGRATFRWPDGRERAAVVELLDPRRRLVLRWSPIVRMP